jgi:hypothetical protein
MWTQVSAVAEFTPAGGLVPTSRIRVFRLRSYWSKADKARVTIEWFAYATLAGLALIVLFEISQKGWCPYDPVVEREKRNIRAEARRAAIREVRARVRARVLERRRAA